MKTWQDYGKEWLDTLVVAISVAMAFRAYFYEPFRIPTGSMQETLWGYHTRAGEQQTDWDKPGLSVLKWLWTGESTVDWKAPRSGRLQCQGRGDGRVNVFLEGSRETWILPVDAAASVDGRYVTRGETIWKGTISIGDFIFVNRWKWNFLQPQDGEVIIFSTTGIENLVQGTHYIKRLKARPGESYKLEHPVKDRPEEVTMGEDEFFACGDNFNNSYDSRYWGAVPRENLRGCGSIVFWPFNRWRIIR